MSPTLEQKNYQTTLIATVGGSPEPIISAIQTYKPNFVIFICSGGKQSSKRQLPAIIQAVSFAFEYKTLLIEKFDNPEACYPICKQAVEEAKSISKEVVVDFSGGTKSMTLALGLTAMGEEKCQLSFAVGHRKDLVKVVNGTQVSTRFNPWNIYGYSRLQELLELANKYQYETVTQELLRIEKFFPKEDLKDKIVNLKRLVQAFYAWDLFNHQQALNNLEPFAKFFSPQVIILKTILHHRMLFQECEGSHLGARQIKGNNYEIYEMVFDLIANAKRKISLGAYDDATGRIYRALELLAQTRLKLKYRLETSDLNIGKLPSNLQKKYEKLRKESGKIQLGLIQAYELLVDLSDPFSRVYHELKNEFLNNIQIRNYSILAHGINPIEAKKAQTFLNFAEHFINSCLAEIKIKANFNDFNFPKLTWEHLG